MTDSISYIKNELFRSLPKTFIDPITNLAPSNERELSTLLALWHNQQRVDWGRVNLFDSQNKIVELKANKLILPSITFFNEYPMFAKEKQFVDIWGSMAGDIVGVNLTMDEVVYIENKIGANFTSGGDDPINGQLARQLKYLSNSKIQKRTFILLSAKAFFGKDWYSSELRATQNNIVSDLQFQIYLMHWEQIFEAII